MIHDLSKQFSTTHATITIHILSISKALLPNEIQIVESRILKANFVKTVEESLLNSEIET